MNKFEDWKALTLRFDPRIKLQMKKILFFLVIAFFGSGNFFGSTYFTGFPKDFFDDFAVFRNNLYYEEFDKEPLNGSYKKYWPNGQLQKVANFKLGVLDGLAEEYLEDGRLKTKILFKMENLSKRKFLHIMMKH